jgi:uncharacterized protein YbaP (TraB family)
MIFFRAIFILTGLIGLISCGVQGTVDERVDAARARNDGPAIWVVKDYDTTLYLFGTVHLLPADKSWLRDDVKEVFDKSGTVFFEADSGREGQIEATVLTQSLGFYTNGARLTDKFDRYQLRLLEAAALSSETPLAALQNMKPWLAAEILTLAAAQQAGLSSAMSADEALKSRAQRQQKNIRYLDDIETQIRASADQPDFVQEIMIMDALEGYNSLGDNLRRTADNWIIGRTDYLLQNVIKSKMRSPDLYQSLFTDRNRQWAKILTRYMEDSGTAFAAVGAGHLLGDDSLITYLKDAGYDVNRYYAFQGEPVINIIELPKN